MKTNEARSLIQTRPKDMNRVKLLLLLCLLRGGGGWGPEILWK